MKTNIRNLSSSLLSSYSTLSNWIRIQRGQTMCLCSLNYLFDKFLFKLSLFSSCRPWTNFYSADREPSFELFKLFLLPYLELEMFQDNEAYLINLNILTYSFTAKYWWVNYVNIDTYLVESIVLFKLGSFSSHHICTNFFQADHELSFEFFYSLTWKRKHFKILRRHIA